MIAAEEDEALDAPPAPLADAADAFAEFEDELEGEATRIEDGHLLAEQSTTILEDVVVHPFLYVEKGNDEGREFVLQEGENGIGRGIDNDVILADVAVSRRHLTVVRRGDTLQMRDLGSGNGTQVNGKRLSTVVLAEGDRIEVGETVLVVRLPGGTPLPLDPEGVTDESNIAGTLPPPAPHVTPSDPFAMPNAPGYQPELTPSATSTAPRKQGGLGLPKPVLIGMIGGAALILAALGATVAILLVNALTGGEAESAVTFADEGTPYAQGVAAYEARQWDQAEGAFREALQLSGSDQRANEYLQRTRAAREHAVRVAEARAALSRGDSNTALTQASAVPDTSPLAEDARAVRTEAQAQQVQAHVTAARAALGRGDADAAQRELTLARNLDPASPAVRELSEALGAGMGSGDEEPEPEPEPEVERERSVAREPVERRGRSRPGASAGAATADIISAYLAGRFDQAEQLARAAARRASGAEQRRLEQLATNIERFGGLYQRIRAARFAPSVRSEMERAIALDGRIARSPHYRDQLRGRVVDSYLAEAERLRSSPVQSCSKVRAALAVDGGNVRARRMSTQCETQARGMMREAANARGEQAQSIYRSVLLMVPGSSAVGREASGRLRALRRGRMVDEDE